MLTNDEDIILLSDNDTNVCANYKSPVNKKCKVSRSPGALTDSDRYWVYAAYITHSNIIVHTAGMNPRFLCISVFF